jgi:carbonic anhydrase
MTKILDEVLAANAKYAENFGAKGNLPLPPSRRFRDPHLHGCPA